MGRLSALFGSEERNGRPDDAAETEGKSTARRAIEAAGAVGTVGLGGAAVATGAVTLPSLVAAGGMSGSPALSAAVGLFNYPIAVSMAFKPALLSGNALAVGTVVSASAAVAPSVAETVAERVGSDGKEADPPERDFREVDAEQRGEAEGRGADRGAGGESTSAEEETETTRGSESRTTDGQGAVDADGDDGEESTSAEEGAEVSRSDDAESTLPDEVTSVEELEEWLDEQDSEPEEETEGSEYERDAA